MLKHENKYERNTIFQRKLIKNQLKLNLYYIIPKR